MSEEKSIFIIILNFNGKKDTLECLKTVKKLQTPNCRLRVVVVDNASNDGSAKAIKNKFPKLKIIENKINLGFAEGNNVGIRYALNQKADYCLILNNDTLVEKELIVQLIKVAEKDEEIGIVSPKIYFAPGFEFHKKRYKKNELGKVIWYAGGKLDWKNVLPSHRGVDEVDIGRYEKERATAFATGCCMFIKKEVFSKVGLFNSSYFMYWEDIDLCKRAKKVGFKIYYAPEAVLWHKNASSSGGAGASLSVYYQTRNRLLFAFKYASWKSKLAVFREAMGYFITGSKLQKKAVKDFLSFKFGKMKE